MFENAFSALIFGIISTFVMGLIIRFVMGLSIKQTDKPSEPAQAAHH